jgi:hypothetical protein
MGAIAALLRCGSNPMLLRVGFYLAGSHNTISARCEGGYKCTLCLVLPNAFNIGRAILPE